MPRLLTTNPDHARELDRLDGRAVYVLDADGVTSATLCLAPVLPPRSWFDPDDARDSSETMRDWTRGIG